MNIIKSIKDLLGHEALLAFDKSHDPTHLDLRVATVVVLLEVAYGDNDYHPKEKECISNGIQREFAISESEATELMKFAEESRLSSHKVSPFARLLNDCFSVEQKIQIASLVWDVIKADDKIVEFEQVFFEHIIELLGLSKEDLNSIVEL